MNPYFCLWAFGYCTPHRPRFILLMHFPTTETRRRIVVTTRHRTMNTRKSGKRIRRIDEARLCQEQGLRWRSMLLSREELSFNANRSVFGKRSGIAKRDCYTLMKPSFYRLLRRVPITMESHCALKAATHIFKKGDYRSGENIPFYA